MSFVIGTVPHLSQPTTLEEWASAFGEKKIHFVKVVVESLSIQELENMRKQLAEVDQEKRGGEFIKLLKRRKLPQEVENLRPEKVREIVQQRFEELEYLKGWREWRDGFGKYCLQRWDKKQNMYDAVNVLSGECAYQKARPDRSQRKKKGAVI